MPTLYGDRRLYRPPEPSGKNNHRIIRITVNKKSARASSILRMYIIVEHCIVFNGQHTPDEIDRSAFVELFDFVKDSSRTISLGLMRICRS